MFNFAPSLTSITIPASVTSIADAAFSDIGSLRTVSFESGSQLQSIGDYAFMGATSLTSITIPASVTSIGSSAFVRATSLTAVTFEAGSQLQSIGALAFYNATALTSITIPASVTSIGPSVFYGWTFSQQTIYMQSRSEANAPDGWAHRGGYARVIWGA